ncbi:MAG: LCP family protein [Oscillospiraceae bacterium]|nr:LCP family protein [Oscillospiraceae bacterium]
MLKKRYEGKRVGGREAKSSPPSGKRKTMAGLTLLALGLTGFITLIVSVVRNPIEAVFDYFTAWSIFTLILSESFLCIGVSLLLSSWSGAARERTTRKGLIIGGSSLALALAGALYSYFSIVKGFLGFFERLKEFQAAEILDLSILAASVLLLCVGGYFLFKQRRFIICASVVILSLFTLLLTMLVNLRAEISLPDEIEHEGPSLDLLPVDPDNTPDPEERTKPYSTRKGVVTFLLAGVNEDMTDTLMVATLDTVNGTMDVMSIPRDTVVPLAPRNTKKINSAYIQRRGVDEPGMANLKKEIASLIGFQPQYSAVIDYKAIERLVDAVQGVDFNVPMRMRKLSEGIDLYEGQRTLSGKQAMQLLRFRDYGPNSLKGYFDTNDHINDDYGRMKIQQLFLKEAGKKALSNWGKMPEYIKIAQENVKSDDIDWGDMLGLAEAVNKIGIENVRFHTLPTYTANKNYYEIVKAEEALALINETINPFTHPIGKTRVNYNYTE